MNHKVIKLSAPIEAHGETISELNLATPTGDQVCRIGMPYSVSEDGDANLNMKKVKSYLVELCGIPASSVDKMSPSDLNSAAWGVAGFFLKG